MTQKGGWLYLDQSPFLFPEEPIILERGEEQNDRQWIKRRLIQLFLIFCRTAG